MAAGEKALDGVKVLEWSQGVAGPYCAKLLADLGAEVIKIEKPGLGDEARRRGPFLDDIPHPERSGLFLYVNTNKLGVTLNPDTPSGKKILKELVAGVDILIEDNPPQMVKDLGLDYESLKEINPRLIMTSITPFGQTGPYRDYKAYHLNIYHAGGEGYLLPGDSPNLDREPVKGGGFAADYDSGVCAAVAALGALYSCRITGLGRHIDVSKQEALIAVTRMELSRYASEGVSPTRLPRPNLGGLSPCKDGYAVLTIGRDRQWQAFVELMGNPEWATDEKYREESSRMAHAAELQPRIREWAREHTKEEIFHQGQAKGCPLGPLNTPEELVNSPQIQARGFFVEVDHPETGKVMYPSAAYRFSETPWAVERPAPLLGQHNGEVLSGRLGYPVQDLVKMRLAGII